MLYLAQAAAFFIGGILHQEPALRMTSLLGLLTHPRRFFSAFSRANPSWVAAYLGYFLITLAGSLGALNAASGSAGQGSALLNALLRALLDGGFSMIFFGVVWMYFGSRLVMGRASLARTVQAVGYAFLWPGLVGALALLLPTAVPGILPGATGLAFVFLAIRLAAGFWALALAAIALKALNGLDWRRTLIAILWLPLALSVIAVGSIVLGGGTPPVQ
jgi:hypothetical protein